MIDRDIGRLFDAAEASFDRAVASSARTGRALTRADDVMTRVASRDGAAREAARRERRRLNAGLGKTLGLAAVAALIIAIATIAVGLVQPLGLFGLLGFIALGVIAVAAIVGGGALQRRLPRPAMDAAMPNTLMVDRLDSYLFRTRAALPAPAQAEVDALLSALPPLRSALETVPVGAPEAQDARRLMATHLPNLVDRYLNIPRDFRDDADGEGMTPDQRLVDALKASREALGDVSQQLAKGNMLAFETQGRFIESRYAEKSID